MLKDFESEEVNAKHNVASYKSVIYSWANMQKLAKEDEADDTGSNELSFTNIDFSNIADFKIDKIKLKNVLLLANQSTADFVRKTQRLSKISYKCPTI